MCRLVFATAMFASALLNPLAAAADQREGKDSGDAEHQIRKALADWTDAANRRDSAKTRDVWAPGVVGWFPDAPLFKDEEAGRVAGAPVGSGRPYSSFALTIDEVLVSGELAVVRDIWRETRHFPGAAATAAREIRSFEVWKPQPDGHWRIVRWISSPEPWQPGGHD
jgi:ketosteroid isomerase-like protein